MLFRSILEDIDGRAAPPQYDACDEKERRASSVPPVDTKASVFDYEGSVGPSRPRRNSDASHPTSQSWSVSMVDKAKGILGIH